ncbi:MAG: hypothetical protein Q8K36_00970 [Alphaproteobacteria bacterium]|nr:hypothetical protein [Alphaproteobacteria bacterium]
MTPLTRALTIQSVFLGCLVASAFIVGGKIIDIFNHNIWLNSLILLSFLVGSALCIYQVFILKAEYEWLECIQKDQELSLSKKAPKILAPLHETLQGYTRGSLSHVAAQGLLSSVEQRLDEHRDMNRYLIGLLVFLGLVGTFWGLSKTIGAIAGVITGIDVNATEIKDAFQNLKAGLQAPLTGMGYAFSSSLFGLLGSLAMSFLDVQVSKVFSKFYQAVERKLGHLVKNDNAQLLSPAAGPAYTEALVEQLAEAMNAFQAQLDRSEEARIQTTKAVLNFSGQLHQFTELMKTNLSHMDQLTHQHFELQQQMARLLHIHNDDSYKKSIRVIEGTTQNIFDELSNGRTKFTDDMRQEIRMLSKTLTALAGTEM